MGFFALIALAFLEIALAVKTCRKKSDRKTWRRDRLVIRAAEVLTIVLLYIFSAAQKWRFVPVLVFLAILLVIAALAMPAKRNQESRPKKPGAAVASCVLCILAFSLLLVPAFFYFPADAAGGERFPLVVFSHGAFGYYQSNTSTYMELASNGYVVAALDHPHHAFFTQDTDGKTVLADMDFISTAMNLNSMDDREVQYALYRDWMALRTADMNFAVDEIKTAAQTGAADESWYISEKDGGAIQTVLGMTDVSRIGLMGHSMGGATAVQLGRERSDMSSTWTALCLGNTLAWKTGKCSSVTTPTPSRCLISTTGNRIITTKNTSPGASPTRTWKWSVTPPRGSPSGSVTAGIWISPICLCCLLSWGRCWAAVSAARKRP